MNTIRRLLAGATLATLAAAASANAGTTVFSGNLGDPGNGALVGSAQDDPLGAPDYGDPGNNVALYVFTVTYAGTVSVTSTAANAAGMFPYFTLFNGSGDGATFLVSNLDYETNAPDGQGDFTWSGVLATGTYEIALGTYTNMSYAEQQPDLYTLGDGFIGLGQYPGSGDYSLTLTTPVPEPTSAWLLGLGLAALGTRSWRARRAA